MGEGNPKPDPTVEPAADAPPPEPPDNPLTRRVGAVYAPAPPPPIAVAKVSNTEGLPLDPRVVDPSLPMPPAPTVMLYVVPVSKVAVLVISPPAPPPAPALSPGETPAPPPPPAITK